MANKKKKSTTTSKSKLSPTVTIIGIFAILLLSVFGVQVAPSVQELFGVSTTTTSSSSNLQVDQSIVESSEQTTNPGPISHGKATFTAKELDDSAEGWIDYHKLDSLERATGADALLKQSMVGTGTSANASIRPPGFISGKSPYGHSRGHLIGKQFGGSGDDERNLVTLYQTPVNSPYMTKYENQIRAALEKGETVRYRVTPIYSEDNLMCKEVHMEAQSLETNGSVNFNIVIENRK